MEDEMKTMDLTEGTRIYYGGDMANSDGFGEITKAYSDRWGSFVDVVLDDGRHMRGLHTVGFSKTYSGNGSTRFVTEAAYDEWRANQIAQFTNCTEVQR